jgi:hypothetical protein
MIPRDDRIVHPFFASNVRTRGLQHKTHCGRGGAATESRPVQLPDLEPEPEPETEPEPEPETEPDTEPEPPCSG